MRLREFWERYQAEKGPEDYFRVYMEYETGRSATYRETIDMKQQRLMHPEQFALLLEADIMETRIEETEYTNLSLSGEPCGGGTYKTWLARIDGDQGRLALGTHPAQQESKAANKPTRTKRRAGKKRRFRL